MLVPAITSLVKDLLFFFLASFSEGHRSRNPKIGSDWPACSLSRVRDVPMQWTEAVYPTPEPGQSRTTAQAQE